MQLDFSQEVYDLIIEAYGSVDGDIKFYAEEFVKSSVVDALSWKWRKTNLEPVQNDLTAYDNSIRNIVYPPQP